MKNDNQNLSDDLRLSGNQPRYLRIAQALVADIADGRYPIGSLLPTEAELCAQYGVSRSTIREAIRRMQQLGLVSRAQGIGTRVEARYSKSSYIMSTQSVDQVMQYASETQLHLHTVEDVIADDDLSRLIGGETGRRWILFAGARSVPGDPGPGDPGGPFCWTNAYIAARYADLRGQVKLGDAPITTPIYQQLCDRFGEQVGEVRQTVKAVAISELYAQRLQVEPGSPGLHIVRQYLNLASEFLEVSVNIYPAGRFEYSMRLRLGTVG
ncbi:GntR family transcriptional regulator [Fodinicurvata sp. EGI_FJ10296]|uniref:GntR family transcriptional regulator n=1 Tax=Fodinicurvata sp. EGI_FJ10296 TaxID=3231908 RepID=UPI003454FA68